MIRGDREVLGDRQPGEAEPVGQGRDLGDLRAADLFLPRLQQGLHPLVVGDRQADQHPLAPGLRWWSPEYAIN